MMLFYSELYFTSYPSPILKVKEPFDLQEQDIKKQLFPFAINNDGFEIYRKKNPKWVL